MSKFISRLSIAALLALGTTVGAQEAEAPAETAPSTEQTEQAEQETGNALAQGLDTGREVQEDGSYIKESFDDWQLKCFRNQTEDTPELCQMYQLLTESEGNPVAEFSLYKLGNAGNVVAGATLAVPLGTLLSEEVKLSVDGGKAKSYAYSFCTMGGCFARIGLTQPEVDALKRGVKATIQIVPAQAPDQTVRIDASLAGFTAAYDAASELSN
ncbi:Invasion protein IalB, involved in pathogenesis [Roseovarius tolerans]|uniref:Invasion protein IalB, involved in pathogenesis n=1 Tax=Roseovarius tolerans TaxID=74031 RepID=A0A1H7UTW1_9RHOB|nr:invasion associated locus B family protein [Roseovarius tolerans]SEM00179.1 Invasion protein IalB, involved in pathogenesis [Roseovarius tolerans]